uniref:Uncharacterized protein n=1 Tax=Compsopogon caeruleus TaxID=31354 RepID=A0A7S1XDR1_9RHOD|mmetsp:Transcript_15208/g.30902  ORF Transcript_15208/g.30902 Transcript_15208/m.30902 type:complete len:106 (+) Transcript_15208:1184-1501(+)
MKEAMNSMQNRSMSDSPMSTSHKFEATAQEGSLRRIQPERSVDSLNQIVRLRAVFQALKQLDRKSSTAVEISLIHGGSLEKRCSNNLLGFSKRMEENGSTHLEDT